MTVHIVGAKLPGKSTLGTKTLREFTFDYNGRLIAVLEKDSPPTKQKEFKPEFTIIPSRWSSALRQMKSAQAWDFAVMILNEAFRLKQFKRKVEIILSKKVTGDMPRNTKMRLTEMFEEHGLIKVKERRGGKALRLIPLL
jgi:hypothetical protein